MMKLWIYENHIWELWGEELYIWEKIIAVIDATFAVVKRKPEKKIVWVISSLNKLADKVVLHH